MAAPSLSDPGPEAESGDGAVFAILGDCFLEPPTSEDLETIREWATRWLALDPDDPVAVALEPLAGVDPADAPALNESFTGLFRGVVPDAPDPPYESLYRDGQLQGPSTQAVREAYRAAGVALADTSGELVDHLGVELHFAASLAERGRMDDVERFVADHPGAWFADFEETILAREPPAFYRGLLALTGLVLAEGGDLDEVPTNLQDGTVDRIASSVGRQDGAGQKHGRTDTRSELDP